jgi:hypothetical protein
MGAPGFFRLIFPVLDLHEIWREEFLLTHDAHHFRDVRDMCSAERAFKLNMLVERKEKEAAAAKSRKK